MPSKLVKTSYDDLTYKIIGCAMALHRERGPGYREDTLALCSRLAPGPATMTSNPFP